MAEKKKIDLTQLAMRIKEKKNGPASPDEKNANPDKTTPKKKISLEDLYKKTSQKNNNVTENYPQINTVYDEKNDLYTTTTIKLENNKRIKEIVRYRLKKEKTTIKRFALNRQKLLEQKFGDPKIRENYAPTESKVKFNLESKKANISTSRFRDVIACANCRGVHFTHQCTSNKKRVFGAERREERPDFFKEEDHSPVIRVNNFPEETTPDDLQTLFRQFGQIKKVKIAFDYKTQKSRGYGFVTFVNRAEAEEAMKVVQNHRYGRMVLNLEWGKTRFELKKDREEREKKKGFVRRFH
ncbi:Eukaryotic translation initiation factor 3 subunit G [Bonamia ostreae]|uniref:Eukaryotic translation initiation factor 3 subunit G n=1 Tax=Bonamia ostreae TaxID=126728 RepID=A0ABV2ANE7_9EUKA